MPVKIKATVLAAQCAEHPAVTAWARFSGLHAVPGRIDVLSTRYKSATYRLFGAGPSGTSVIVQYSCASKAAVERIVYQDILPCLPLTAPRCYGLQPESAEHVWLFLEDVGDQRYEESNAMHRGLAARWIAMLHCGGSQVAASRSLPETGPQRYLTYLLTVASILAAHFDDPLLSVDDADLLRQVAADLEALEGAWPGIERACAEMPVSVGHGDFRPKNGLLRQGPDGLGVFPIDWETAGWGIPAADLTRIDPAAYLSVVQSSWWRGARLEDVERVAAAGAVFRYLSSLFWIVPDLGSSYKPIPSIRFAHMNLRNSVQKLRALTDA
jgi:hypothetical protein